MPTMRRIHDYFIADNATVLGDIVLHPGVNIWYGCTLRGDVDRLILGPNVNLQDGVIMHADTGYPNEIESGVVVGHRAILHGQRIGRGCLIGMGAIVLGKSTIGEECVIAAGCLIKEGMVVPPRSLVAGVPGRIIRQITDDEAAQIKKLNDHYLRLAQEHADGKFSTPW